MLRPFAIAALALCLAACGTAATNAAASRSGNDEVASTEQPPAPVAAAAATPDPVSSAAAAEGSTADFGTFWARFRSAALAGDAAQLQALSSATVKVHGELDDDPATSLTAAKVPAAIAAALAAPDGQVEGRTVRAYLEGHDTPKPDNLDVMLTGGERRVGPFVFKSGATGWRLAELYAEDS